MIWTIIVCTIAILGILALEFSYRRTERALLSEINKLELRLAVSQTKLSMWEEICTGYRAEILRLRAEKQSHLNRVSRLTEENMRLERIVKQPLRDKNGRFK
jgi:prephenate dehydrogenase